jgi:hypothetical protein
MEGRGSGSRRHQWIALILSGVFPGLGQLFVRAWGKGVAFLLAGGVLTWALGHLVSPEDLLAGRLSHPLVTLALILALLGVFLWSLLDAWRVGGRSATSSQAGRDQARGS